MVAPPKACGNDLSGPLPDLMLSPHYLQLPLDKSPDSFPHQYSHEVRVLHRSISSTRTLQMISSQWNETITITDRMEKETGEGCNCEFECCRLAHEHNRFLGNVDSLENGQKSLAPSVSLIMNPFPGDSILHSSDQPSCPICCRPTAMLDPGQ